MIPIFVWHDIKFIREQNVCLLPVHSARGFIWSILIIYGIPIIVINIIYIQLTRFIRRSSKIASTRAKRDVIVVRRIVLVAGILTLMGIPSVILKLMLPFTDAAFRFFRVVSPSYVWLQYGLTYAVIIPILWIFSFLSLLPVHFWHDIQLMPTESICVLTIDGTRGFIWCTLIVYGLPVVITSIIYIQLTRFMHHSSMTVSLRARRDVIVIRRIVLVIIILMLIGAPSVVLKLILPFTDLGKSFFYRMSNMTIVIVMLALSLMLVYVTPQVKEMLMAIGKSNKVTPRYTRQFFVHATITKN
ncbi:unnamed protein product [Rotaria sp. Silwood1]|nr:unnamed protein product [Rotaria sp. Silwood1]